MEFRNTEIEKIRNIIDELEVFRKEIIDIDYIHNKEDFFEVMERFRKYLVKINVGNNFEIFYHSKFYKFYKSFFTEMNEYYLRSLESMQSISVMTQGIHNFDSISEFLNGEFLKEGFERKSKEFSVINYENVKKIVFVGCGPFPETMLYVYENFKVESILGLDFNHEAIYMAGELMNGLGYDNITFKQTDAINFDYSDADIVFMPLFTLKKHEILDRIEKTGKNSVQILSIEPKYFLNLIFESMGENVNNRLRVTHREYLSTDFSTQEIIKLEKYDF